MALAMEWVAKITTVCLEMVLPAFAGSYLDRYLKTQFLTPVGLALGVVLGIWHLIQMTKRPSDRKLPQDSDGDSQA
jgi:hypothetical protein